MTDTAARVLTYGRPIRAAAWDGLSTATVFTVRGYAAEYGADAEAAEARAASHGHDLAGSVYTGSAIVGDRAYARLLREEAQLRRAAAVTLATGDLVEIEGRRYVVKFAGRNELEPAPVNCDPIKFLPVA